MDYSKLLQNNPEVKRVMQLVGSRDPKEVFYEECKKKNIDPEMVLRLLTQGGKGNE